MNRVQEIATSVIAASDRDHPADAMLRNALRQQKQLPADLSRAAACAVFAYYRWLGWLDRSHSISEQLRHAEVLDDKFRRSPESFSLDELMARAVPNWVAAQVTVTLEWLRSLQQEPPVWIRARLGHGEQLARQLGDCRSVGEGRLRDSLIYGGWEDLFRTPEFQAGEFELQDLSSQIVGFICHPQGGEKWWDACAGEGGKTLHLSELMWNKGLIWASDRAEWRLRRLKLRAARAKAFNFRTVLWDGGAKLPTKTKFDGVLVDAPCSGIGTWHRNPQARWTTTPQDVQELGAIQEQILTNVVPALKPGGRLIYAVCTLAKRETSDVAAALTSRHPELKPKTIANPLEPTQPPQAQQWFWPQLKGGNGMFVAVWEKA